MQCQLSFGRDVLQRPGLDRPERSGSTGQQQLAVGSSVILTRLFF